MASDTEPRNLRPRPPDDWLDEMRRRFPAQDPEALAAVLRLINLGRAITGTVTAHFVKIGLTEARFTLVMMIYRLEWKFGFATPSQLAQHSGIGKAAMTQMLDGLMEAGWIDRSAHPDDRRKLAVRLTPASRRRLERFLPGHFDRIGQLTAALTASELHSLNQIVGKLEAGLAGLRKTEPVRKQ
jgi:MarR family 2-MHQ and catechol resistance regulon transcriptional repressor